MRWPQEGEEERVGPAEGGGSFGGVHRLVDEAICCPQLAVATPMGFQILTLFDNVSVERYPWLAHLCVCACA